MACLASLGTDSHNDRAHHSVSTSCLKRGCWTHYPSLGTGRVVLRVDSSSHTVAVAGVEGVVEEDQNSTD